MKKKMTPHIIAVVALIVFIVLGLACASTDSSFSSGCPGTGSCYVNVHWSPSTEKWIKNVGLSCSRSYCDVNRISATDGGAENTTYRCDCNK